MDDGGGERVEDREFVDCFVLGLRGALGARCCAGFAESVFYGFVGCEERAGCLSPLSISTLYIYPFQVDAGRKESTSRYCRQHNTPNTLIHALEENITSYDSGFGVFITFLVVGGLDAGFEGVEGVN